MFWLLACTAAGFTVSSFDTGDGPPAGDLRLTVDPDVVTMLRAEWQDNGAPDVWVEYRWEGDEWLVAPVVGPGSAVLLGIPAETEVEARVGADVDGETWYGDPATIVTGTLPGELLVPSIDVWDEALAWSAPYAMISVDMGDYTYQPPFWIEIFDRSGRVVWYKKVEDDMMTFYPTVALDGTHIWFEGEDVFGMGDAVPGVTRQTLDGRWSSWLQVREMGQAVGEGPDGSFYFEQRSSTKHGLGQVAADGDISILWDCSAWMRDNGENLSSCDMNTTNWSAAHNSVLASMFESSTVFEIDLDTNEPIRQMGQLTSGEPWAFSPAESMFDFQHHVYWTDAGTLLASTHVIGESGVQVAAEYTVDDATKTLTRVWSYVSTDIWAAQVGEAVRLPNGNTVQGYGQDGAVREVTSDGTVVWQASWVKDRSGARVVGHLSLIEDLYAINRGM